MAIVRRNILLSGVSGSLGDRWVIQMGRGGQTIIRSKPGASDQPPSPAQEAQRQRFREAIAYAKETKGEAVYVEKAAGTVKSAYNVAVADWLHPPEVVEVDLAAWRGGVGETLRARVRDDVKVEKVTFVIAQADGTLVEEGAGVQVDGLWWAYVTTVDHPFGCAQGGPGGEATVLVIAQDLPGHTASQSAGKSVT